MSLNAVWCITPGRDGLCQDSKSIMSIYQLTPLKYTRGWHHSLATHPPFNQNNTGSVNGKLISFHQTLFCRALLFTVVRYNHSAVCSPLCLAHFLIITPNFSVSWKSFLGGNDNLSKDSYLHTVWCHESDSLFERQLSIQHLASPPSHLQTRL